MPRLELTICKNIKTMAPVGYKISCNHSILPTPTSSNSDD